MGVEAATSVLLLADAGDGTATCDQCDDLLRATDGSTAELRVSYSAADVGPHVSDGHDRRPAQKGVVSVGDEARAASDGGGPDFSGPVAVDAVEDPGDLRGVGISISRFCERWSDANLVVCFDSLGDLLSNANDDAVFRFTTLLNKRLDSAGAVAHFHLDPDSHDDSVVTTFGSIFDDVVQPDGDGDDGDADVDTDDETEASDEQIRQLAEEIDDGEFEVVEDRRDAEPDEKVTEASDEEIADIFE